MTVRVTKERNLITAAIMKAIKGKPTRVNKVSTESETRG